VLYTNPFINIKACTQIHVHNCDLNYYPNKFSLAQFEVYTAKNRNRGFSQCRAVYCDDLKATPVWAGNNTVDTSPWWRIQRWRWSQYGLRNVGFQPPYQTRNNPENHDVNLKPCRPVRPLLMNA